MNIFLIGKSVALHLHEGCTSEGIEKSFEPMTSQSKVVSSTARLQCLATICYGSFFGSFISIKGFKVLTLQDPVHEGHEPRVLLGLSQGREPHLPIQPAKRERQFRLH